MSQHPKGGATFTGVTVVVDNRKFIDSLLTEERLAAFAKFHGFEGEDYNTILELYLEAVEELDDDLTPHVSVIVVS